MSSLSTYEQLHQRPGSDVFTNWLLSPFRRGPKTSGLLPAATNPLANALTVPDPAAGVPPNPVQLPQLGQANPAESSMTGAGVNAVSPVTETAAQVQPGVQAPTYGRPGIQTTIYRHQMEGGPAQREYIFDDNGLEIPGAAARLEDRMAYNQQLMDAMRQAGGDVLNSPQLAALMGENTLGQKTLSERIASEAEKTKGEAALTHANWEQSPQYFRQQALGSRIASGQATPPELIESGLGTTDEALAGHYKTGATSNILDAMASLKAQGITGVKPGDPGYRALSFSHPAALQNLMASKNPYAWRGNPANLADTLKFFSQPGATPEQVLSPAVATGTSAAAPNPGVLRKAEIPKKVGFYRGQPLDRVTVGGQVIR